MVAQRDAPRSGARRSLFSVIAHSLRLLAERSLCGAGQPLRSIPSDIRGPRPSPFGARAPFASVQGPRTPDGFSHQADWHQPLGASRGGPASRSPKVWVRGPTVSRPRPVGGGSLTHAGGTWTQPPRDSVIWATAEDSPQAEERSGSCARGGQDPRQLIRAYEVRAWLPRWDEAGQPLAGG